MHSSTKQLRTTAPSILAALRALAPRRALSLSEALRIAELQASRLLALRDIARPPILTEVIADFHRIAVEYDFGMPEHASGASDWDANRKQWIITVNGNQPEARQRFTVLHEYKHILDHGQPELLPARDERLYYGLPAVEYVADYFAGCLLMPRLLLKRAWAGGLQRSADLAALFNVSERAIEVRLGQVGLRRPASRCLTTVETQPKEVAA